MEDTIAEKLLTIAENEQNVFNAGYEKGLASGGVTINNQDKTITENGVYQADEGYTGLGTVTVEVASTGGGDINALIERSITEISSDVEVVGPDAFGFCEKLITADFSRVKIIRENSFAQCYYIKSLIIRTEEICQLFTKSAFSNSNVSAKKCYIYVPKSLLSDDDATKDYRRATNWSIYAAQFRALEDYTVDGTITGELDESKI